MRLCIMDAAIELFLITCMYYLLYFVEISWLACACQIPCSVVFVLNVACMIILVCNIFIYVSLDLHFTNLGPRHWNCGQDPGTGCLLELSRFGCSTWYLSNKHHFVVCRWLWSSGLRSHAVKAMQWRNSRTRSSWSRSFTRRPTRRKCSAGVTVWPTTYAPMVMYLVTCVRLRHQGAHQFTSETPRYVWCLFWFLFLFIHLCM